MSKYVVNDSIDAEVEVNKTSNVKDTEFLACIADANPEHDIEVCNTLQVPPIYGSIK